MDKRTCTVCNLTLDGSKRKYCSRQCANRALTLQRIETGHRTDRNHPKVCELCSAAFRGRATSRFCSLACQHAGTRASRAATVRAKYLPMKSLEVYRGEPSPAPEWLGGESHGWLPFVSGPCNWCGENFTVRAQEGRFCSERCLRRHHKHKRRIAKGRWSATPSLRLQVAQGGKWTCHLCKTPIPKHLPPTHLLSLTLDHVVPQSLTPTPDHSPANLLPAHRMCNSARGNRPIEQPTFYLEMLERIAA
jgi:5-methylcytosine-specific restriction endonuclease McrA